LLHSGLESVISTELSDGLSFDEVRVASPLQDFARFFVTQLLLVQLIYKGGSRELRVSPQVDVVMSSQDDLYFLTVKARHVEEALIGHSYERFGLVLFFVDDIVTYEVGLLGETRAP